MKHTKKGFTLIELLVVIAIVSLLASVILASLSDARAKAKDSALKQSAREFEKVVQLHYEQYGTYLGMAGSVESGVDDCGVSFATGIYASQAEAICENILTNSPHIADVYNLSFIYNSGNYSIGVLLNRTPATLFCVQSSGEVIEHVGEQCP